MYRREFRKSDYDMADGPAKTALIKLLTNRGHTILNDKETYKADIISKKNGLVYANEGELKKAWKAGEDYKYPDVRIAQRKCKLLKEHAHQVLNFYVFRADFKAAWRIKDTSLKEERLAGVKSWKVDPRELFYVVPVEECELVYVNGEDNA